MDQGPPYFFRGGHRGFEFGPVYVHHGGSGALAWATFALVLLLVVVAFASLVAGYAARPRLAFGPPGPPGPGPRKFRHRGRPDPLEVLRMRYASGQITREEYLQTMNELGPTAETPAPPPTD